MQVFRSVFLTMVLLCAVTYIQGVAVSDAVWKQYKKDFLKSYSTTAEESNARFYYAYNLNMITTHNLNADKGKYTYRLAHNQFTDMRLITFNALFPQTTQPTTNNAQPTLPSLSGQTVPNAFDPRINFAIFPNVRDQGVSCSSGWAYATASSIELRDAMNSGYNFGALSAQQLIDCARIINGCVGQVPQTAFDYLTKYAIPLNYESTYKDDNTSSTSLPCRLRSSEGFTLRKYATKIADGSDSTLKAYVAAGYPVVTEFNPTSFEFMHYSSGIFTQPATVKGSHYMLVIGYDAESWILLNSFGETWGEGAGVASSKGGYMRLKRNDAKAPLPKAAALPTE